MSTAKRLNLNFNDCACLLLNHVDGIVYDLVKYLQDLQYSVWPSDDILFENNDFIDEFDKKEYELLIEEAIEESKIIIVIITKEFVLSKNSIDRVNNIKKSKFKSVLGLVIEKI